MLTVVNVSAYAVLSFGDSGKYPKTYGINIPLFSFILSSLLGVWVSILSHCQPTKKPFLNSAFPRRTCSAFGIGLEEGQRLEWVDLDIWRMALNSWMNEIILDEITQVVEYVTKKKNCFTYTFPSPK